MTRRFRTRVRLYTLERELCVVADCTLVIEAERFAQTRWWGTLSNLRPVTPAAGRYLMRFPDGRTSEVEVGAADFAGCPFRGAGPLPLG